MPEGGVVEAHGREVGQSLAGVVVPKLDEDVAGFAEWPTGMGRQHRGVATGER